MRIRDNFLYAPEGGPTGEPTGDPTDKTPPATTFSAEYVRELRQENATWRTKAQTLTTEAATHRTAAEAATAKAAADIAEATKKATTEAAATVTEAMTKADARVIRSELRTAAVKLGMVDLDALKMLDITSLKTNADGDVEGVDALLDATKKAKAYLFGSPSTSSTQKTPPADQSTPKSALTMTDAEFAAAKASKAWLNK